MDLDSYDYDLTLPTFEFEIDDQAEWNLDDLDDIPTEKLFRTKYKKMLLRLNISLEPHFVIYADREVLREREEALGLRAEQRKKVKEVRRKGRNCLTAVASRKRQQERMDNLQKKVEKLKELTEEGRNNLARCLQEKQEEEAKLHHLELQVELQDYVQRQQ